MTTEDQQLTLLEYAKAGDRRAFGDLTRPLHDRLVGHVRSRIGPSLRGKLQPDDIVQDALLKAFESIHAFRGTTTASLWSWLRSISEHLILNASRRRSVGESSLSIDLPGEEVSPSRGLRREERRARLERSLDSLKPEQRELIVLAKVEGLSASEIASRVGRSEEAVRQAISRGLKKLRERFGDTESLHLPPGGLGAKNDDATN